MSKNEVYCARSQLDMLTLAGYTIALNLEALPSVSGDGARKMNSLLNQVLRTKTRPDINLFKSYLLKSPFSIKQSSVVDAGPSLIVDPWKHLMLKRVLIKVSDSLDLGLYVA